LQGFAQAAEIVGFDRKQPGEHPRLYLLKARQWFHRRPVCPGEGIAHGCAVDVLDTGDDVTDFTGAQAWLFAALGGKNSDGFHLKDPPGGHHLNFLFGRDPAIYYSDQRNDPDEIIEPGIDDQGLERSIRVTFRRRNTLDDLLHQLCDAKAALGADPHGMVGIQTDDVTDLVRYPFRVCRR